MNNYELGILGQEKVLEMYLEQSYILVAQNFNYYQTEKEGELDLIFEKGNKLTIVEVKTRSNDKFGDAALQITKKKLLCVYKSYQGFVKKYPNYAMYFVQMDLATVQDEVVKIYPNCYSFEGLMR
jgi:Holliday junction resolvase-like predicted endonuclease